MISLKTYIILPNVKRRRIPEEFHDDDNRSADSLIEDFIHEFTQPGDIVFDPFAGLGTTLLTAEDMGRIPFGIEADEKRYEYTRSQMKLKENILLGDSRKLSMFELPQMDFAITSPIFMRSDETQNPLSGFKEPGTYNVYLDDLQNIFGQIRKVMKPRSKIVVEVFNLSRKEDRPLTMLAWDMARVISRVLRFEIEIIACWQGEDRGDGPHLHNYDHSYCLMFSNEDP